MSLVKRLISSPWVLGVKKAERQLLHLAEEVVPDFPNDLLRHLHHELDYHAIPMRRGDPDQVHSPHEEEEFREPRDIAR